MLFEAIAKASRVTGFETPEFDKAILDIQTALGVTDGQYAGVFFSSFGKQEWASLSAAERKSVLVKYSQGEFNQFAFSKEL